MENLNMGNGEKKPRNPFERLSTPKSSALQPTSDIGSHGTKKAKDPSIPTKEIEKELVNLTVNRWQIEEKNKSYVVNTGGCGAIKLFVKGEDSNYSIVFHSYGTEESKTAAEQIASYIIKNKDSKTSVEILNIQPYKFSRNVQESIDKIKSKIKETNIDNGNKIKISEHAMCLNNLPGQAYSNFIGVCLDGSKAEIIQRYDNLVIKDRKLSEPERNMKIGLFQQVPASLRTPEFIREWSQLTLEQSKEKIDEMNKKLHPVKYMAKSFKKFFLALWKK